VAAAIGLFCQASPAQAGAIQLNDFSDMSAGRTSVPFPGGAPANPLTMTAGAINLTYSTDFFGFTLDDGSLFAFPPPMTPILLNNQGNGPITIEFSTGIQEFGFLAQNVAPDTETFTFEVFGPTSLVKTFFVGPANNTVPPGVALFLGARATDTDVITRLVVSSASTFPSSDNFFAVGPVTFVEVPAAEPVPEPASLLLLGSGLLAAGVRVRQRRTRA
jgi:hypothetical protein